MTNVLEKAKAFYDLENFEFDQVGGHDGGRNLVYVCRKNDEKKYVLRISSLGDRTLEDYEADERGEFPPDLKRGVLSQDALFDLLERGAPGRPKG